MPEVRIEMARFMLAGLLGLLTDIVLLYLALALGLGWLGGRALSFTAAVWVTWQINRRYAFGGRSGGSAWHEWWRYLAAMAGGGVVNTAVYSALTLLLRDHALLPLLTVSAGSLAGMVINFLSAKFWVFRR